MFLFYFYLLLFYFYCSCAGRFRLYTSVGGTLTVGDCSADVCRKTRCQSGGSCVAKDADSHTCLCPIGQHGNLCQHRQSATFYYHLSVYHTRCYWTYVSYSTSRLLWWFGSNIFKSSKLISLGLLLSLFTGETECLLLSLVQSECTNKPLKLSSVHVKQDRL